MDGLDIALTHFKKADSTWSYEVIKTETIPYQEAIYKELRKSSTLDSQHIATLDKQFGEWIAEQINTFVGHEEVNLLAIHGHTAIHKPKEGISIQLGSGSTIANSTGIPTVTEFRSLDVSIGGEGAPLVPFGDFNLFEEYDACLNLGGIANISYRDRKTAWDICPCNQVLNFFAQKLGYEYDPHGSLSRSGTFNESFLSEIEKFDFFSTKPPKSLPNNYLPFTLLDLIPPKDGLRSYCHFIACQLAHDLSFSKKSNQKILVTGGGAFNTNLMNEIKIALPDWKVTIPDATLISFKEAIIFAFLGLKRHLGEINVLSSVTGGRIDTSSGVIHFAK